MKKPHIVLVIPRGEAVRNFLYSDVLPLLAQEAKVTLLSVIHDEAFIEQFQDSADIIPLEDFSDALPVTFMRNLLHNAHFWWLGSGVARNRFETHDSWMTYPHEKLLRWLWLGLVRSMANVQSIEALASLERWLTYTLRPTKQFDKLWSDLAPDLVFNTSHIHGNASSLPMRVAYAMGIPTGGFIFSWDNLTSRSHISVPYRHYLVWHERMKADLLKFYSRITPEQVEVTGSPQLDFHFKPQSYIRREELAAKIGFDPSRPFVLYTTGIDKHFPEEHHTVEAVIRILREEPMKPQLVVRTYVKGTSAEMYAIRDRHEPDVFFPKVEWDDKWFMPAASDQQIYSTLLKECALGINAASTVSLELMIQQKPVVNLGFNPPDSNLPEHLRWSKHTDEFDHYIPVTNSGAVMVARSVDDLKAMIHRGLCEPEQATSKQPEFLQWMFGAMLDGKAGERVAETLLALAQKEKA